MVLWGSSQYSRLMMMMKMIIAMMMMTSCVVVCIHSGLCAAHVCIPAVEGVWVWAHGGVDGSGRREHRRPWTNGGSTVQPSTQLYQLQVNTACVFPSVSQSVCFIHQSSTAEPAVCLLPSLVWTVVPLLQRQIIWLYSVFMKGKKSDKNMYCMPVFVL